MIKCSMLVGGVRDIDESVSDEIQRTEAEGWGFHSLAMSERDGYIHVLVVFRKV